MTVQEYLDELSGRVVDELRAAALAGFGDGRRDYRPVRALLPGHGHEPAPEPLWRAVNEAVGQDIRRPLEHGGFEQPNIAKCRVALKWWAIRTTKGE